MTQSVLSRGQIQQQLMSQLLDRGYTQAAGQVLSAIGLSSTSGLLERRLAELQAEAQRLDAAGQPLTADNPILRAVQADFAAAMQGNGALIRAAGEGVQNSAAQAAAVLVREFALPGLSNGQLAQIGVRWNVPDPEAIQAVVGYTAKPAFDTLISRYVSGVTDTVSQAALRGIIQGQSPLATARDVRDLVHGLPLSAANTTLRTLQLTAYRDATVLHQVANADITQKVIRVAALDDRTCMACVALNGTELEPGERVDDHYNGRCTSVVQVYGRQLNVQSGEDWFNARSEDQQRDQMGDAAFEAWKAGAVTLQDFVHTHSDPTFGDMITEASLKGMLGDQAKAYYSQN